MQGDPLGQLAAINQELIRRRQTFTERDPGIAVLQRERDALRRYIETTGGGSLALPGQRPASKDEAQSILLRYQELERTAKRDTATLDSLENTLLSLQLEQARATKPWELISNPTLLDKPVSPRPVRNLALGLLAGLVLGSGGALLADRRTGGVFSRDDLLAGLPYPLLAELDQDPGGWTSTLQLLVDGPLANVSSIALIPVGEVQNQLQALESELRALLPASVRLQCTPDLHLAAQCERQVLVASLGRVNRDQLLLLQQNLKLQARPVAGLVLL